MIVLVASALLLSVACATTTTTTTTTTTLTSWGGTLSEELYVVGDSSDAGWSPPNGVELIRTNDPSYIFKGTLFIKNSGYGFKFVRSRDGWDKDVGMLKGSWEVYPRLGYGAKGTLEQTMDTNIPPAAVAGMYELTVDLVLGTWHYECVADCDFINAFFPAVYPTRDITLLYTGKMRGALLPVRKDTGNVCTEAEAVSDDCIGGLPYVAAYAQKLRDEGNNVLLLDTGEFFLGGDFYPSGGGGPAAKLAKLAGYDAMGSSARDLAAGTAITDFAEALDEIPLVLSNAQLPASLDVKRAHGQAAISRWARVNTSDGAVGVLSMVAQEAEEEVPGLSVNNIRGDVVATMQKAMAQLLGPGGDAVDTVIVMMSHNSDSEPNPLSNAEWNSGTLAQYVPYMDVMIGGATSLGTVTITDFETPLLAFGWENTYGGRHVQRVDFTVNANGVVIDYTSTSVTMDKSSVELAANNAVLEEAYRLYTEAKSDTSQSNVLGTSSMNLFYEGDPSVLQIDQENLPILNVVTEALYQECGDCDLVIMPPGVVDSGLAKGDVHMSDVSRMFIVAGEEADFVVVEIPGAWLMEGLKELFTIFHKHVNIHGLRLMVHNTEGVPYKVAGIYVKEGTTFEPIQRAKTYRMGMPRYVLTRKQAKAFGNFTAGPTRGKVKDLFSAYIAKEGSLSANGPIGEVPDVSAYRLTFNDRCVKSDKLSAEDAWANRCWLTVGDYPEEPALLGLCPVGEVLDPSTLLCTPCPAGTYWTEDDLSTRRFFSENFLDFSKIEDDITILSKFVEVESPQQCLPCQAGQISGQGQESCDLCEIGKFNPNPKGTVCSACPRNAIAPEAGMKECEAAVGYYESQAEDFVACPGNKTTLGYGAKSVSRCSCPEQTYLPNGAASCKPCPLGMVCPFGAEEAWVLQGGEKALTLQRFYWSTAEDPLEVYRCCPESLMDACDADACPGGLPGRCEGDRVGLLCAECERGSVLNEGTCKPCNAGDSAGLPIFFLAIPIAAVAFYYVGNDPIIARATTTLGAGLALGIFFTAVQVLGMFRKLSIPWPGSVGGLLGLSGFALLDLSSLGLPCMVGYDPVDEYAVRFVLTLLVVPLFLAICALSQLCGEKAWSFDKALNCCGAAYQVFFIGVVITGVVPFQCFEHPNEKASMTVFPGMLCQDGSHSTMMGLAVVLFVVVVAPFAALSIWATTVAQKRSSTDVRYLVRFRFLLYRFRPDVWWWGPVVLVRQLLLAFAPLLQARDPASQITYCVVILICYQSALCFFWPWKAQEVNILDAVSGGILAMLIVSASGFLPKSDWTSGHSFLMVLVLVLFLAGAILALIYVVHSLVKGGRKGQLGTFFKPDPEQSVANFVQLCQAVVDLSANDKTTLDALFREMNEYDLSTLRRVMSMFKISSGGAIDVAGELPMRLTTTSESENVATLRREGSKTLRASALRNDKGQQQDPATVVEEC